jgi:hypothetical protein
VYGDIDKTAAPGAAGEEWRGRPALRATLRLFDTAFFRKVSSPCETAGLVGWHRPTACTPRVQTHFHATTRLQQYVAAQTSMYMLPNAL